MADDNENDEPQENDLEEQIRNTLTDVMPEEALEAFKGQAQESGSLETFAQTLYNENQTLREERRKLKQKVNHLRANGPEGAAVLDEETAEALKSKLPEEKSLEDLPELFDKAFKAAEKFDEQQKVERREEAAEVAGVNEDALGDLEPTADYEVQEVEDEDSGETIKRAIIKTDGESKPLKSYLKEKHPEFEPILFPDGNEGEEEESSPNVPGPSGDDDVDATGDDVEEQNADWVKSQRFAVPENDEDASHSRTL